MIDELLLAPHRRDLAAADRRTERLLGSLVCGVILLLLGMIAFIVVQGWPSFAHNGLRWFGAGGNVDQQIEAIFNSGDELHRPVYTFHAWPLIWSTLLTTGVAAAFAFAWALLTAIFMVELAPAPLRRLLDPVTRLLASVPSVVLGLIGVLVVVPFIGNHLITQSERASVAPAIPLSGYSLLAAVVILTVEISPIMTSIFADGLRAVPRGLLEASMALGVSRWRSIVRVAVLSARPALVAGTVLGTARALGESVMLSMVSGSIGLAPNPADGLIFLFEPSRGLAPTILQNNDQLSSPPMRHTLFAIAAVLLLSSLLLSLGGWVGRRSLAGHMQIGGAQA